MQEKKIYNYCGIAVMQEKENSDCWGCCEGESVIHLKFGEPFKMCHFSDDFVKKHPEFVKYYHIASGKRECTRKELLYIWREIIYLHEHEELVVILNMCDMEVCETAGIIYYAISQDSKNNWTWNELTAREENK